MEAIGVDVGGTNLRVARVNAAGQILDSRTARTDRNPETALSAIIALASEVDRVDVKAIGVGVPGRVDTKARRMVSGGFLDFSRVDLVTAVEEALAKKCILDTDANHALLAEWRFGAARGCSNVLMLTIGTGIGGAAIVDGRLLRGARSSSQFGHVTVDFEGRQCRCGRLGCVETTSSGTRLGELIKDAGLPADTRIETLLEQAESGHDTAKNVLLAWARPLRAAIDSLVASFDPDRVLLGGGLGPAAHRALAFAPAVSDWYRAPVVPAELSDAAGVVGGAWAALEDRPAR